MDAGNNQLDSLYTSKREIESIISGNTTSKRLKNITARNGTNLEKILENTVEIYYDELRISSKYSIRDYEMHAMSMIKNLNNVNEFSKNVYKGIKFEIEYKENNGAWDIEAFNAKNERIFSIGLSKSPFDRSDGLKTVFLITSMKRTFAQNPSFSRELFSLINDKVIINGIENSYKDILLEGVNANENQSTADLLKTLGIEVYKSDVTMKNVGGYSDVKERIEREIFTPFAHKEILEGIRRLTRVSKKNETNCALFYGEPGTGKTLMARVISNENNLNFVYMSLARIYSNWYGDSAKRMEFAFDLVNNYSKENGKTVLFIDELDSLGNRQYNSNESNKVLNVLLTRLSGIKSEDNENLLLVGCTNLINSLDDALLSRFKSKVYFRKPDREDRKGIISNYSINLNKNEIEEFAERTDGFTGRDLESIASIAEENLAYDIANKKKRYDTPKLEDYLQAINLFRHNSGQEVQKSSGMYR